jgi:PAS domain S-box-containing protein
MSETNPIRVLCVEDDAGLARLFQRKLERAGYQVDLAHDGDEGLAKFDAGSYDVLAVDYNLPDYDGLEVIRRLASRGTLPPTIMLTAHGDEKLAVAAMKLGARDYIVKDAEGGYLELLPSVFERLLEQQRLIEANRQAVEALRESEERFRLTFEDAPIGIVIVDSDYNLLKVNKALCQMLGYSEQELTSLTFVDITHPEDVEKDVRLAEQVFKGEIPSYQLEKRYVAKNGEIVWINLTATVIRDQDGKPRHGLGMIENIAERKRAEAALQAAARLEATATLAGGIAHQFNNLMCGVLGNAELLQMKLTDRPDMLVGLAQIAASAHRASELAGQLLAFAQGGKYQSKDMSLNETIRETLRMQESALPPSIRVQRELEPTLWAIKADRTQMSQLVMNLYLNAVEAILESGRILITTRNVAGDEPGAPVPPDLKPGRYVCLSVEDTGCGMNPEVRAKVFEPFFTTKFQGRGLGLAAVYGIVKNHGGAISISSEVGQGTTFKVYLPAAESEVKKSLDATGRIPAGSETILVIDDDEVVLSVTQKLLEHLGYRILIAHDGQEALDVARTFEGRIDLAVLDLKMPGMDGSQVYPRLREAQPEIKVIVCSGYELDAASQALLDAGASAFLRKPYRIEALAAEIRKALEGEERS